LGKLKFVDRWGNRVAGAGSRVEEKKMGPRSKVDALAVVEFSVAQPSGRPNQSSRDEEAGRDRGRGGERRPGMNEGVMGRTERRQWA
jgi:hypothetical protein